MKRILALLTATLCITPTLHAQDEPLLTLQDVLVDQMPIPRHVVIPPDGAHVYIISLNTILVNDQDSMTGALTPIQALTDGIDGVTGIGQMEDVVFSSDGEFLFTAATTDDTVASFARDVSTGFLTFVNSLSRLDAGLSLMRDPEYIAVSPDRKSVYVSAATFDSVIVFDADPSTGELSFLEALENGTAGITNLGNPGPLLVSPDQSQVYVTALDDDVVAHFNRDLNSGALTFVEVFVNGVGGVTGIGNALDLEITSDGTSLYIAARGSDAVAHFTRNVTTGALTFESAITNTDTGFGALNEVIASALSADDSSLYIVNDNNDRISVFARNPTTGVLSLVEVLTEGGPNQGLDFPKNVAVMPDGKFVYTVGNSTPGIGIFSRESVMGQLTYVDFFTDSLNGINNLVGVNDIAISADGKSAYFVARNSGSLSVFSRDRGTGEWTILEEFIDGVSGVDGLGTVNTVVISPDGGHVYCASQFDDAVSIFSRNLTTGALTFVGFVEDEIGGVDGIQGATAVAVSPDNNHVYAGGISDGAVAAFSRNTTTGELTFIEAEFDDNTTIDGLSGMSEIICSPDGKHLYIAGSSDDAIAIFSRNAANGEITYIGMVKDGVDVTEGLDQVEGLGISNDGNHLYAVGKRDDMILVFTRDASSGALTFVEALENNIGDVVDLNDPWDVKVSKDGGHVYAVSHTGSAAGLVVFARDLSTGQLTYVESYAYQSFSNFDGEIARGLRGAQAIEIAPDSSYINVAAPDDGVTIWEKGVVDYLRGTITELASGNPVTCGVIEIANGDRSVVETAVTDANGFYFFTNIPTGTYSARVISPGLGEVVEPSIAIGAGAVAEVDIELPAADSTLNITGTITDAQTMVPLVGVLVEARIANVLVATTYTCATGVYGLDLPGLKGDNVNVELTFTLDNYDPIIVNESVDLLVLSVVDIAMSKSVGFPSSLTGTVLDDEGEALGGATVTIRGPVNANATTDGAGGYAFDCTDGTYTIRASKAGYEGETGTRSITGGGVAVKTFMLEETGSVLTDPEDINRDMSVNSVDIQIVINKVLGVPTMLNTDVDNSGTTNSVDIQLVINKVLGVK